MTTDTPYLLLVLLGMAPYSTGAFLFAALTILFTRRQQPHPALTAFLVSMGLTTAGALIVGPAPLPLYALAVRVAAVAIPTGVAALTTRFLPSPDLSTRLAVGVVLGCVVSVGGLYSALVTACSTGQTCV